MTPRRLLCFSAVVLLAALLWLPTVTAEAQRRATPLPSGAVTMAVRDVSPNSVPASKTPKTLTVALELTNNTSRTLDNVVVSAVRSDPINNTQQALNAAIENPRSPTSNLVAPLGLSKNVALAPTPTGDSVDLVFRIHVDTSADTNLCFCANAIYPLYFTADYTPSGGTPQQVATAQTYVPSFTEPPTKALVTWMWPLLDRPHRLLSDRLFTDDELAQEVAPGGRLDQLLTVAEDVGRRVPMTIITDPELIDELVVMSHRYHVKSPTGPVVGTGTAAATSWLARLRRVLALPGMELSFTPDADPPVEALQQAGLNWKVGLPTQPEQQRVSQALGLSAISSDIAWPTNETISSSTLAQLISQGTSAVVVNDRTLAKNRDAKVVPNALAPVSTTSGSADAAVTNSNIEKWVETVLAPEGPGLGALPQLVAQVALHVTADVDHSHYLVLTPPRNMLAVDPTVAARAILATADTPWSTAVPLRAAAGKVAPVDHGALHAVSPPRIPTRTLIKWRYVLGSMTGLSSLFRDAKQRAAFSAAVPRAVLRCQSTALLANRALADQFVGRLTHRIRHIRNGVVLVPPLTGGNYTLASKNSRLPVTITNHLGYDVDVVVGISGAIGFTADSVNKQIPANSTVQIRVPTHVDRVGLFYVQVTLSTSNGLSLSTPLQLTVHSTALGAVGVVITIVAAVVLVAALLIRFIRRMRHRGPPEPVSSLEPVPAATATS